MMDRPLLLAAALALDLVFGDPRWFPHPVKAMGRITEALQRPLLRLLPPFWAGLVLWLVVTGIASLGTLVVLKALGIFSPGLRSIGEVLFLWTSLSLKDLKVHAMGVFEALREGDLKGARGRLSLMVSRDTAELPPHEIARGAVESVAENTADGVISPMFFALLGGAPLAMAFKAVSTLDSMVGHHRFGAFGAFSARMDDLWNFLPARITGILTPLAALLCGMDAKGALRVMARDHGKTPSPNSGYPEAAFAGALGVRLGGPTSYGGKVRPLPWIGEGRTPGASDIPRAVLLSYLTSLLFLSLSFLIPWPG